MDYDFYLETRHDIFISEAEISINDEEGPLMIENYGVRTKWGKKRQSKKGRASKVQNGAKKGRATFEVIF